MRSIYNLYESKSFTIMKKFRKITNIISTVLIAIAVILALSLLIPKVIGYDFYAVLSSSMSPKYPTGSMVYAKEVDVNDLEIGDVIMFEFTDTTPATHRIHDIIYNEDGSLKGFITKGDNRDSADQTPENPLNPSRVIGRVDFGIVALGYIVSQIQRPIVLVPTVAVLLLVVFLPDIVTLIRRLCGVEEDNIEKTDENNSESE